MAILCDEKIIEIDTEFITLGQFLKLSGIISNGGEAKMFLSAYQIEVNGELESRRGRKLRSGDKVLYNKVSYAIK